MKQSIGTKRMVLLHPVFIVGTYDERMKPNIMNVAWGGICCSDPPCVSVSIRKATYTYGNLRKHKAFTVSIPSVDHVRESDYIGIYSGKDEDKFASLGLTPVRSSVVTAPYVDEFPLVLECTLIHTLEIGLHTQFIGKILDVKADPEILDNNNLPDLAKMKPFIVASNHRMYFALGQNIGTAYAIGRKP